MARCAALKPVGTPCERIVGAQQRYCFSHDPSKEEARRRIATKGGKGRGPSRDVAAVSEQLQQLADDVLAGDVDKAQGAVGVQALTARLKALELLRRWHETDELERRVDELARDFGSEAGRGT